MTDPWQNRKNIYAILPALFFINSGYKNIPSVMREQTTLASFNFYQNAHADAAVVKENFLVRQYEYEVIADDLLRHSARRSVQHYLLHGKRGSGKSTLLRRLQVEIETNE